MDQSKTSDRGQGDGGPDIISGAVAKGLQGVREIGKQASSPLIPPFSDTQLANHQLQRFAPTIKRLVSLRGSHCTATVTVSDVLGTD